MTFDLSLSLSHSHAYISIKMEALFDHFSSLNTAVADIN